MTRPSAPGPPSAAFFDFDRTVFDGDAGVLFGAELLRIRWRRILDDRPGTLGWLARLVAFATGFFWLLFRSWVLRFLHFLHLVNRSTIVRIAYRKLSGQRDDELRELAHDYFDEIIAPRIYPDALAEMRRHREEGRRVVIATTNMHLLVDNVRRHAPVDDVIAVHFNAPDGILDGTVQGPLWGEEKATAIRDYAHRMGLSLPRSYAYSDHHSDLHFLQLVGNPIVINPEYRIRLSAWRRKWPVVRWKPAPPKPNGL